MADIKAIKGTNNVTYDIVDRFSDWGGYNYLPASKGEFTGTVPSSGYSDFKVWNSVVMVQPNDVWTLSFEAKASAANAKMTSYLYNNTSGIVQNASVINSQGVTGTSADGNSTLTLTTSYEKYWITWTFNSGTAALKHCIAGRLAIGNNTAGTTVTLKNVKLEKGHKATDWSPSWKNLFTYASEQIMMNI